MTNVLSFRPAAAPARVTPRGNRGPSTTSLAEREALLAGRGVDHHSAPALLAILGTPFDLTAGDASVAMRQAMPWPDEPFVAVWDHYATEAQASGDLIGILRSRLVQLAFDIEADISGRVDYLAATRRGQRPSTGAGLTLVAPERIRLTLHQTAVGRLPVLTIDVRSDFEQLVRAFVHRNEPAMVPASMGACLVAGYNNWDRVASHRRNWEADVAERGSIPTEAAWIEEFRRFAMDKSAYQDRFMLLSTGPYSNVSAAHLGLDEADWRDASIAIRLEHECAHYVTRRLFGAMRQTVLDELLADHAALLHARGEFDAAWFLRFLGLEDAPAYRQGGRLENYLGEAPLSETARTTLHQVIADAAATLERFTGQHWSAASRPSLTEAASVLIAIATIGVEALASAEGVARLEAATFN